MALLDFIGKQFIDVIEWADDDGQTLAWRVPMPDREIQTGARLVVRPGQQAVFIDQGRVADVFNPGTYTLSTRTLPVLTNLRHWDKLFASPFKSDVVYLSTRVQLDQRWGTAQPVVVSDSQWGAVPVRAHGLISYRVTDATRFLTEVVGARALCTRADLDEPLRAASLQALAHALGAAAGAFVGLAARLPELAAAVQQGLQAPLAALGLSATGVQVQSVSLPEALQHTLNQGIGVRMVGDDPARLMAVQAALAVGSLGAGGDAPQDTGNASGTTGPAGQALGLGAGVALGQVLAQQVLQQTAHAGATDPARPSPPAQAASAPDSLSPPQPSAPHADPAQRALDLLRQLGALRDQGVLTAAEFDARKAALLAQVR